MINDIYRHYDVCGKNCPLFYVKNSDMWNKLKKDIATEISNASEATNTAGGVLHSDRQSPFIKRK